MTCRKVASESNGLLADSAPLGDVDIKSKVAIHLTSRTVDPSRNDVNTYRTTAVLQGLQILRSDSLNVCHS